MKLSVIIVNYNVKYFLEQCLLSVIKAMDGIECEILVVDNNSVDGSVELVKKKFPDVRLIANTKNTGFSFANNQAIRISTGEYVLLLNPDTVVEEDTFSKVIAFMDHHPDAGGLGVKMIDGKGNFLPESKRGLPTPAVAFYKISGLSALFPTSKIFGRYHLGFLDKDKTHVVDILSGAFMLLRRTALDKTGLLDETFFMYGEDIDLSYRITLAGYHNYYFPDARIIHYKGESTKKSSVNYVMVFYKAMKIFADKHYSEKNARTFSILISFAIYFRAGAAILSRLLKKIVLPCLDAMLMFAGMYVLTAYWEKSVKVLNYPVQFIALVVPAYILTWLAGIYFSGGYDRPISISKVTRGIFSGTLLILVVYALLPEAYRFSRALILIGTIWAFTGATLLRYTLSFLNRKNFELQSNVRKRIIICGKPDEGKRVLSLLQLANAYTTFIGFVNTGSEPEPENDDGRYALGEMDRLRDIIDVYSVNEVIFCGRDVPSHTIIDQMLAAGNKPVEFKIAPPESIYIIGSNSINDQGDLYFVDMNVVNNPVNRRNKRMLDIAVSLLLVFLFPFVLILVENKTGFIYNLFSVITGKKSWVGFAAGSLIIMEEGPGNLKPGVLNPADALKGITLDQPTVTRLNMLYARDYKIQNDLRILWKGIRKSGR